MGYMIRAIEGIVTIPAARQAAAAVAVIEAVRTDGGYWRYDAQGNYVEVDLRNAGDITLRELLEDVGFEVDDIADELNIVYYYGKASDDVAAVGPALAGFATEDSYLVWLGEEAELWRWYYTATEFYEQTPTITWPEVPADAEGATNE